MASEFMVGGKWSRRSWNQAVNRFAPDTLFIRSPELHSYAFAGPVMKKISALLLLVLAGCSSLATHPPRATDLSGDWQLNESLSDDPQALMRAHRREQGYGHGGRHRGGMPGMGGMGMPNLDPPGSSGGSSGGGYGGHQGGGHGGGGMGPRHNSNNEFLIRPDKLTIKQETSELHLVADGVPTDYTYGDKVMASVQNGAAERTSGWKGKDFVVKYDVEDGPKASRSYELSDDGKRLTMTTEVSGGRSPDIKFRSVYERQVMPATSR
jgi:hypothetical protein